jgi:hypothetical protein
MAPGRYAHSNNGWLFDTHTGAVFLPDDTQGDERKNREAREEIERRLVPIPNQ